MSRAELHAKPIKVFEKWVVKIGEQGLYRAADKQLKQAWLDTGLSPCPRDGHIISLANDPHLAPSVPMELVMPDVAPADRTDVQVQDAVIVPVVSAQQPVAVVTECPACEASLGQGVGHFGGCVVNFAV